MYETFCSSYKFFAKLVERYHIPESDTYSEEMIQNIRSRICSILTKWIRKKFFELDTFTKEKIENFISGTLIEDGFTELSSVLEEIIQKHDEHEKNILCEYIQSIPKIPHIDPETSLYAAFLASDEKTIAEQLTLHDWNIFRRIKVSFSIVYTFMENVVNLL